MNNNIEEIKELENLSHLQDLNLKGNLILKLKSLNKLIELRNLDVSDNYISKIEALENLKNIKILNLEKNQISDISGLNGLKNLKELNLSENNIKEIKGLDAIEDLEILLLEKNSLLEIKGLENLSKLKKLTLHKNKIPDGKILKVQGDHNVYLDGQKFVEYCRRKKLKKRMLEDYEKGLLKPTMEKEIILIESEENKNIQKIISEGEGDQVEFKSSLRWDYKANRVNKNLEYVITKEISGFLNSEGGVLFIGGDDNGNILGLKNDYKTFKKILLIFFPNMLLFN